MNKTDKDSVPFSEVLDDKPSISFVDLLDDQKLKDEIAKKIASKKAQDKAIQDATDRRANAKREEANRKAQLKAQDDARRKSLAAAEAARSAKFQESTKKILTYCGKGLAVLAVGGVLTLGGITGINSYSNHRRNDRLTAYQTEFAGISQNRSYTAAALQLNNLIAKLDNEGNELFQGIKEEVHKYNRDTLQPAIESQKTTKLKPVTTNRKNELSQPVIYERPAAIKEEPSLPQQSKLESSKLESSKLEPSKFDEIKSSMNSLEDILAVADKHYRGNTQRRVAYTCAGQPSYTDPDTGATFSLGYPDLAGLYARTMQTALQKVRESDNLADDFGNYASDDQEVILDFDNKVIDEKLFDIEYKCGIWLGKHQILWNLLHNSRSKSRGIGQFQQLDNIGSENGGMFGDLSTRRLYYQYVVAMLRKKVSEYSTYRYDSDVKARLLATAKDELLKYRICFYNSMNDLFKGSSYLTNMTESQIDYEEHRRESDSKKAVDDQLKNFIIKK